MECQSGFKAEVIVWHVARWLNFVYTAHVGPLVLTIKNSSRHAQTFTPWNSLTTQIILSQANLRHDTNLWTLRFILTIRTASNNTVLKRHSSGVQWSQIAICNRVQRAVTEPTNGSRSFVHNKPVKRADRRSQPTSRILLHSPHATPAHRSST